MNQNGYAKWVPPGGSQTQLKSDLESKNENIIKDAGVTTQQLQKKQEQKQQQLAKNKDKLLQYVRDNVIGSNNDTMIQTAYGEKPLVYADYTASGKSLRFIEKYQNKTCAFQDSLKGYQKAKCVRTCIDNFNKDNQLSKVH